MSKWKMTRNICRSLFFEINKTFGDIHGGKAGLHFISDVAALRAMNEPAFGWEFQEADPSSFGRGAGDNPFEDFSDATAEQRSGRYFAHLHFEMREFVTPLIGPGYREDTRGWLDPTAFIDMHGGAAEDDIGRQPLP